MAISVPKPCRKLTITLQAARNRSKSTNWRTTPSKQKKKQKQKQKNTDNFFRCDTNPSLTLTILAEVDHRGMMRMDSGNMIS